MTQSLQPPRHQATILVRDTRLPERAALLAEFRMLRDALERAEQRPADPFEQRQLMVRLSHFRTKLGQLAV